MKTQLADFLTKHSERSAGTAAPRAGRLPLCYDSHPPSACTVSAHSGQPARGGGYAGPRSRPVTHSVPSLSSDSVGLHCVGGRHKWGTVVCETQSLFVCKCYPAIFRRTTANPPCPTLRVLGTVSLQYG